MAIETGPAAVDLQSAAIAGVQRRVLRVLTMGQIVGGAALASAVTVGAFVIQDMLGQDTPWAGIGTATVTTGTAFVSQMLARRMGRVGRRPGLQLGYVLAATGGVVAAAGAELGWLPVFLLGLFVFGSGQAANLLSRYAATDLAAPDERGTAMSRILFASTFGAVLGPVFVTPAEHLGEVWFGLERYAGPWLFSAVFFAAAAANTGLRLRPDPLVVAGGTTADGSAQPVSFRAALDVIRAASRARLALAAMVISQATMVAVMTMTPVHLKLHGHEGVSPYVISLHIAGMFVFSPLIGRFSDRRGRLPTIALGAALLTGSTVMAAASGDVEQLLFPALWALGVGWSFGLIGGSSLLVDSVPVGERVGVQGAADLLMSFCGGLAGLSSGFIRGAFGFHILAQLAMLAAAVLLALAIGARRTTA